MSAVAVESSPSSDNVNRKRPADEPSNAVSPAKAKPATVAVSPLEIAEIVEHIFQYLPAGQVIMMRSVCPSWRQFIDGSSRLMSRVWIKVPNNGAGNGLFFPPGANSIVLGPKELINVDSWWPRLGQILIDFKVRDPSNVSEQNLMKLLQLSPKLKRFHLECSQSNFKGSSYVILKELEELKISLLNLNLICPRLKRVQSTATGVKINQFLISVRETVEDLTLKCPKDMLYSLVHLNRMKRLDLSLLEMSLDEFEETLCIITREMSELTSLKFSVQSRYGSDSINLATLGLLTKLETLAVGVTADKPENFRHASIQFGDSINPELKELSLTGFRLYGSNIEKYLSKSTRVHIIKFKNVRFENSWHQLYSIIEPHCLWLKILEVKGCSVFINYDKCKQIDDDIVERIIKECRVLKRLAIDGGVIQLTASLLEIFQRGMASK